MPDKKKEPSQNFLDRISDWTKDNIIIHHGPNHPSNQPAPVSSPPDRTPGKITDSTQPRSNTYPHVPGGTSAGGQFTGPGGDGANAFNEMNPDIPAISEQISRPPLEQTASGIPSNFDVGDPNYRPAGQQNIGRSAHEIGWKSSVNGVDISHEQVLTKYDDQDIVSMRARTRFDGDSSKLPGRVDIQREAVRKAYGDGVRNWEGIEIQHNRVVDIVIGGPGAGKSDRVAEPMARAKGATLLDADLVKRYLPGYNNGEGAGFVHNESSTLTYGAMAHLALEHGDNIVMPLVGANQASLLEKIQMFKDAHYTVNLHYVDVPPEEQMRRVISRFKDPTKRRFVDPTIVLEADDRPRATFEALKMSKVFAHTTWYDNSKQVLVPHPVRAMYYWETRSMGETHGSQETPSDEAALIEYLKQFIPDQTKAPLPLRFVNDEDILGAMMKWRQQRQQKNTI